MRFKYCVAMLLLVAVIGVIVLVSPAAAVKTGDSVSVAGPGGYYVKIVKSQPGTMRPMLSSGTVIQDEYDYICKPVNYYTTQLPFDLYWGNPSNSLRLRIITPDDYVLGPYYDLYDGSLNGEINLYICRDGGVAQGDWHTETFGYSVSGSQGYTI